GYCFLRLGQHRKRGPWERPLHPCPFRLIAGAISRPIQSCLGWRLGGGASILGRPNTHDPATAPLARRWRGRRRGKGRAQQKRTESSWKRSSYVGTAPDLGRSGSGNTYRPVVRAGQGWNEEGRFPHGQDAEDGRWRWRNHNPPLDNAAN